MEHVYELIEQDEYMISPQRTIGYFSSAEKAKAKSETLIPNVSHWQPMEHAPEIEIAEFENGITLLIVCHVVDKEQPHI